MNTTDMITTLKIKGSFPASNDLFSTSDYINIFNHQMKTDITPLLMKLSEEYFLQSLDFTISPGGTYRIPRRAIGAKVRNLSLIDGNGNVTQLPRLFEEDRPTNRFGYYMLRNSIELSSDITSGTLRMKYFAGPNTLVETSACAQIQTIDPVLMQVEVTTAPSTFANSTLVDIVQNNNPYDLLAMDFSLLSVSGTTLTFASLPDGLSVGDWVCLATESPVPMIPEELHPVLVQSSLVSCLSSKKDKALEVESVVLEKNKKEIIAMLDPRVENNSVKFRSGKLLSYISRRRY